jgi:hypothetical protein
VQERAEGYKHHTNNHVNVGHQQHCIIRSWLGLDDMRNNDGTNEFTDNHKLLIKFGTLSLQPEIVVQLEHGHDRIFRMDMRMGPIPGSTFLITPDRVVVNVLQTDIKIDSGIGNIPRLCTCTTKFQIYISDLSTV